MPSLKVGIEPQQDLHGYDHPWAGGAGKNLLNNVAVFGGSPNIYSANNDADQTLTVVSYDGRSWLTMPEYPLAAGTYTISRSIVVGNAEIKLSTDGYEFSYTFTDKRTFTLEEDGAIKIKIGTAAPSYPINNIKVMIELGSTATSYEPYSNICPISGWTAADIAVSPTTSAEDGTTYTIEFKDGDNPLVIYGGTLNAISGLLTVTDAYIASYNAETLPSTWISDRDVYAEGATPTTGAEVVYKLANSVTYQLTPTQIRTLVGNNNIWADTGNIIEGKYFKSPY
jgi:hypothetical protein